MTAEHPESVAWDEQRAELQAVLASEEFTRAPTLGRLLSYLCEKVFSGEADRIKEYSIGVEVFHRGSSFDQDTDSIVRVEANRLRKRLAQYYADDGALHRLQIAIPVGQYVPKFEAAPARTQDSAGQSVSCSAGNGIMLSAARWSARLRRRVLWIGAVPALVLLGLGGAWLLLRHKEPESPPLQSNRMPLEPAFSQVGPPPGEEIRILAGGDRSLVDHAGKLWSSDIWYSGGTVVHGTGGHIWRTLEPGFYRNSRQGQFRYDIPLRKGTYELRLHFAETAFGPEASALGGEGSRLMSVRANGKTLLAEFDVVADAGASRTADVKIFPGIEPAADGALHLEFFGDGGNQAMLSAMEILPALGRQARPVRIITRQSPYYSNDSHWWSPDDYFEGGQLATYPEPVIGIDDPELYETERWGNFSYAIPVAPGKHTVILHFVARRHESSGASPSAIEKTPRTSRVFDVFCNGKILLDNFDLSKEVHKGDVVVRKFSGLEPNAQGKLFLSFTPVEGYATVTALEVIQQ